MFRGKKYQESAKQIDKAMLYDPKEGLELICKTAVSYTHLTLPTTERV